MTIRKPSRVTSHASMPRAPSRWQPGFTRNRASAPGQEEPACPAEDGNPQEAT
jgi:hypothetical protein